MVAKLRSLIDALFGRRHFESGMDQEMTFHLESYTEDLVRSGVPPPEAERRARVEFGGMEIVQEQCRRSRGLRFFDEIRQDFGYGLRVLRKNPGFTFVAIIAITLGIGANSAVFSVLDTVILRPLPFNDPSRIMALGEINQASGATSDALPLFSAANFVELEKQQQSFETTATMVYGGGKYTNNGETEDLTGFNVTEGFFSTFGVAPLLGRTFNAADMRANPPNTIVLSYRLWRRKFAGDPSVLGQTLALSSKPYTIIGIMPEQFRYPLNTDFGELWLPQSTSGFRDHSFRYLQAFGRLKPGVSEAQARNEMKVLSARLAQDYPASNKGWSIRVMPLDDYVKGDIRRALQIIFAAGCCVLLVACANVANLTLARATARRRELSIRAALGASRGRLVRQVVTESMILTFTGGALGMALAWWAIKLVRQSKPEDVPRVDELTVNWRALLFTLTISVLAGCACGLIAGRFSTRDAATAGLNDGGSRASGGVRHMRVRNALIVAEISLSLVLLVNAGLLMRSFYRLTHDNPGFDSHNIFTASLWARFPTPKENSRFYEQFIERVQAILGIESAGLVTGAPLTTVTISMPFSVKGEPVSDNGKASVAVDSITPDFLKTLRIGLKAGRNITPQDKFEGHGVALINETLARRFFGSNDRALGREVEVISVGKPIAAEIVGVIGDTKRDSLAEAMRPAIYLPISQAPWRWTTIVARTRTSPGDYTKAVQQALHELDGQQELSTPQSMDAAIAKSVAQPRFYSLLLGAFALIAVILASVGLYGVIAYMTSQRTQEIGIRVALGAQTSHILKLILGRGMMVVLVGVLLGIGGALVATRFLESLLYGIGTKDIGSYLLVSLLLVIVSLFACYVPARRASKVDPLIALRCE